MQFNAAYWRGVVRLLLWAPLLAWSVSGQAQVVPKGPVTIVCPYGPGTGIDVIARIIAPKLAEAWNVSVVVRNQPGASGNIGAEAVANAPPDGNTVGIIANSHFINQIVSKNVVDLQKVLEPVAPAGTVPYLITVSSVLPAKTLGELIALARSKPGEINFSGIHASVPHLLGSALKAAGDIDIRFISYKSTIDAMADAISGRVPIWLTTLPSALPVIQSGKVRALAVTGEKRAALLPNVPTMKEEGHPSLNLGGEFYFFVPAGTPKALVATMNHGITAAMNMKDVREKLAFQGAEPSVKSPEEMVESIRTEAAKWAQAVKLSGIAAQ
jgi:tripartite-type tricarboxylate transporter receptor subunit TctC